MEHQISQAVQIALSGTSDPALKNQAIDFINHIKSTEEGYNSCVNLLVESISNKSTLATDEFKFFLLQVIDENIPKLPQEELYKLNTKLFEYLRALISSSKDESAFLKNKFTEVLSKIFCLVYLNIAPAFLQDYLQLVASENPLAVDYYLRLLVSIHQEIGDKLIARSKEISDRNALLKDAIREKDMPALVMSWHKILKLTSDSASGDADALTQTNLNNCLIVIGSYVNWMDISLFVSTDLISLLYKILVSNSHKFSQKIQCCATLTAILSKKMKPNNKLELINLLSLTSILNDVNLSNNDLEYLEALAKLVNQIGAELLVVLESSNNDSGLINQSLKQLVDLWPYVFQFLANDYDEICQQVFPFIQSYLLLSKKFNQLCEPNLIQNLLNKIILKMKFDDEDDGEDDDDVQVFNDFRSNLKKFQDSIAILVPDLYLEIVPIVITEAIFDNTSNDWRSLELGLYELLNFADSVKNNLINVPKPQLTTSKPFQVCVDFLVRLINSDHILNVNHRLIQLSFFELLVKHFNFLNETFKNDKALMTKILEIFSSDNGLFNNIEKVRLRTWYLFFRYIKLIRPVLNDTNFMEKLLIKLQPLLVVKAEAPVKDDDAEISDSGNFYNQLNLFESVGVLIVLFDTVESVKLKLIDLILAPLFNDLENCIKNSGGEDQLILLQSHHLLMAIGTFARGYDSDGSKKYSQQVREKFGQASQAVLFTLETFSKHENIRDASRFAFSRFIPILNDEINNQMSKLISIILASDLSLMELNDFVSFINQIIHVYQKNDNVYQLLNDLFTPLIKKIFETLDIPPLENEFMPDVIRDKNTLKRALLTLLSTIILNHQTSLLITETNKQIFPVIVDKVFEFSYDLTETATSKSSIIQLTNFISVLDHGKIIDTADKFSENLPAIEGIDDYLIKNATTLSFELPFKNKDFNLKDAQYRQIAQEIASLLKTLQVKKNERFLAYLSDYLTNIGLSDNIKNDFGTNLVKLDVKSFKTYFIAFVTELRGE